MGTFSGECAICGKKIPMYATRHNTKDHHKICLDCSNEFLSGTNKERMIWIYKHKLSEFENVMNSNEPISTNLKNKSSKKQEQQNTLICPKCGSTKITFAGNKRKSFSVGKAVGGAVLTGGIGTLAGFAGKKGKKNKFVCLSCGKGFEK